MRGVECPILTLNDVCIVLEDVVLVDLVPAVRDLHRALDIRFLGRVGTVAEQHHAARQDLEEVVLVVQQLFHPVLRPANLRSAIHRDEERALRGDRERHLAPLANAPSSCNSL